jgi:hypothetical protein
MRSEPGTYRLRRAILLSESQIRSLRFRHWGRLWRPGGARDGADARKTEKRRRGFAWALIRDQKSVPRTLWGER